VGNISQTDYGYTGQRNLDSGIGLMDYKARFYSPYINRFIQPDTLIPDPSNPQNWNRYSYVGNRPINFNDPTGHTAVLPLVYIGITFFAITALAVTAHAYANNPEFHASVDQIGRDFGNSLQALKNKPYTSKRQLDRVDTFNEQVGRVNSGQDTPRVPCTSSVAAAGTCIGLLVAAVTWTWKGITRGGTGEDESNFHPRTPNPTLPPTSTPSPTPSSTPSPTSTPTSIPTPAPTNTPAPIPNWTPINLPHRQVIPY
jgi:RHS repeat-associated protein